MYFTYYFSNEQQPVKASMTKKCQYRQEILVPVIAKWGPAFNIPTNYTSFFNFLYSLIKFNIKQATTKI